ncbi:ATP-binding protein [Candidatus Woesearchaeota archaeon]|nr:ATP-binding protein [Candidatus Woesearchaeota archaeon]
MAYEIVIGRSAKDREKFGLRGTILLGKHYVKMGQVTSLSSEIYLDVNTSHIVFVCGKRGSGKSYTLGAIAEGAASLPKETSDNICMILLDTMGVYWTMKYPNLKDAELLKQWKLEGKGLDIEIYTPKGYFKEYKEKGIPTDYPFSIRPAQLAPSQWCMAFEMDINSPAGILIERVVLNLKKEKDNYSIKEIIDSVIKDERSEKNAKDLVENQFLRAKEWGVFSTKATPIEEIAKGGKTVVIDLSCYATMPGTWGIKSLVIGVLSQQLFIDRMVARKAEEYAGIRKTTHYFVEEEKLIKKRKTPLVWLVIDEAHEFLPREGKTAASDALITILREGRQPGISLILATQQPGKIHTDVMTQSDTVISHRLTAKMDVEALGLLMQSYMRKGLAAELDVLPRVKGAGIVFDDQNEKMYPMRVRPRFTWHGGESPTAIREIKRKFEL